MGQRFGLACSLIYVENNKVRRHHTAGIFLMSNANGLISDAYITANEVSHSYLKKRFGYRYGVGIQVYPGFGGAFRGALASHIDIRNNRVHNNHGIGIDLSKHVVDSVVSHNQVWNNGSRVPASGIHVGGVEDEHVERIIIADNKVWGQHYVCTDGAGILVDDFSREVLVTRNVTYDNEEAGIKLHNCRQVRIIANRAYNNPIGIKTRGADSFALENNSLSNNATAIDVDGMAQIASLLNNLITGGGKAIKVASRSSGLHRAGNCVTGRKVNREKIASCARQTVAVAGFKGLSGFYQFSAGGPLPGAEQIRK